MAGNQVVLSAKLDGVPTWSRGVRGTRDLWRLSRIVSESAYEIAPTRQESNGWFDRVSLRLRSRGAVRLTSGGLRPASWGPCRKVAGPPPVTTTYKTFDGTSGGLVPNRKMTDGKRAERRGGGPGKRPRFARRPTGDPGGWRAAARWNKGNRRAIRPAVVRSAAGSFVIAISALLRASPLRLRARSHVEPDLRSVPMIYEYCSLQSAANPAQRQAL